MMISQPCSSPPRWHWVWRQVARPLRLLAVATGFALCAGADAPAAETVPAVTLNRWGLPRDPLAPTKWTVREIGENLQFDEPVFAARAPGDPGALLILERRGMIWKVAIGGGTAAKQPWLDVSDAVQRIPDSDRTAYSFALHPDFGQPGANFRDQLFLFYTTTVDGRQRFRLSRFPVREMGTPGPTPETRLIDHGYATMGHIGGAIAFGSDRRLYVAVGDGSEFNDNQGNGQLVNQNLFGGVLRLDVDESGAAGGSHAIIKRPREGTTGHYRIPDDNPFNARPGALEEFWAIGLRSPFRMAFDNVTHNLWLGDVGQDHVEEVNCIVAGGNCEWSFREGDRRFDHSRFHGQPPGDLLGIATPPVFAYPHANMNTCVVAGGVYRGAKYAALASKFIFGDHGSGRVWSLTVDAKGGAATDELCQIPIGEGQITSILAGAGDEIYITLWKKAPQQAEGRVVELTPTLAQAAVRIPRHLSELSLFSDLKSLTPHPDLIAYEVNVPFWSDGAVKRRWFALPDGAQHKSGSSRIGFQVDAPWRFPADTLFVKHFELPIDEIHPERTRRLETRLLVRDSGAGVYGLTYRWNAGETDAELMPDGGEATYDVIRKDGQVASQTWAFPSRADCVSCHNRAAGYVLGVRTRQVNREVSRAPFAENARPESQIAAWSRRGLFDGELDLGAISALPRNSDPRDEAVPVVERVRSYLDANCSQCHCAGSDVRALFDARSAVPLDRQNLLNGPVVTPFDVPGAQVVAPGDTARSMLFVRMASGEPNRQMPPLSRRVVDESACQLFSSWIASLRASPDALVDLSDEFHENFRDAPLNSKLFYRFGCRPGGATVRRSKAGLRIRMPVSPATEPSAGVEVPVSVTGNFEIIAGYELIDVPEPPRGFGAGASLTLSCRNGMWTSLQRVVQHGVGDVCVAHIATPDSQGKLSHFAQAVGGGGRRGSLRLRRLNSTLHFAVADDDSSDFREICRREFSAEETVHLRLTGQTGEAPTSVDVAWRTLKIRAAQLSFASADTGAEVTVFPGAAFWIIWSAVPFVLALLWLGLKRASRKCEYN